jgi:hypothetical protein
MCTLCTSRYRVDQNVVENIKDYRKRDKRRDQIGPAIHRMPFPALQYNQTKDNRMFIFIDTVDTIMAPAMVVPCNI